MEIQDPARRQRPQAVSDARAPKRLRRLLRLTRQAPLARALWQLQVVLQVTGVALVPALVPAQQRPRQAPVPAAARQGRPGRQQSARQQEQHLAARARAVASATLEILAMQQQQEQGLVAAAARLLLKLLVLLQRAALRQGLAGWQAAC